MSFREKSAWITFAALALVYGVYFLLLWSNWDERLAQPMSIGLLIAATVALVTITVASHVLVAILEPKNANARADEREIVIELRSERIASYVLSTGVVCLIGALLLGWNGALVANLLLACLVVSELVKAAAQIAFHRADA
jgi:hypothetical protein